MLREKREENCFNNTERTRNKQDRKKNLLFRLVDRRLNVSCVNVLRKY